MSNIAFIQFSHLTKSLNGAENYHHNFAKKLQAMGHKVVAVSHAVGVDGMFDGVPFYTANNLHEHHEWADIVVTSPGKIRQPIKGKRYIFIQHNQNREPFPVHFGKVIYCAQHVADNVRYSCLQSAVLWPFNRYDGTTTPLPENSTGKITLINCNRNKGGHILADLARAIPGMQFLGITSGYGHQIKCDLPNVEYREGNMNLQELLADTSIVIMPSEKEGLPTLALECASLGVPLLMADIDAARELQCWRAAIRHFEKELRSLDYWEQRADAIMAAKYYSKVHKSQLKNIFSFFE